MKKIFRLKSYGSFPIKFDLKMKLTTLFLIVSLFQLQANESYGQKTKVTLDLQNVTFEQVLNKIESLTEFKFLYNYEQIDHDKIVSVRVKKELVSSILDKLFKDSNIVYKVLGKQIILKADNKKIQKNTKKVVVLDNIIQETIINGVITDSEGLPLPGANILEKGTTNGTQTDFDGNFSLSVTDQDAVIIVSYIGFTPQQVSVNGKVTLAITLQEDAASLDEVVVVGYGTQKASEITGSISTVKSSEIADLPVGQITQKLQGKVSGVQISQTTGTPGGALNVRIRGASSINGGTTPLYVVDGYPISGDLSSINSNEIESISILKDAASASLYGSRAAAGVVLITTKRGKLNTSNFTYSSYVGVQVVPEKGRPDVLNAREFAQFSQEVAIENGRAVDPIYQNPEQYGEGTDWYDVLTRNAIIQEHTLSYSSRTEKSGVSVIGTYFNQEGNLLGSEFKRYSLRINSDYTLSDKVKVGFSVAPSITQDSNFNTDGILWDGGILQNAILTSPIANYINPDGSIPTTTTQPGLFPNPNWYNVLINQDTNNENTNLLANAFIEVELLKGLKFRSSFGYEYKRNQFRNFNNEFAGSTIFGPPPSTISAQRTFLNNDSWLAEEIFTYNKAFGKHKFELLAGYTVQEFKTLFLDATATNFPDAVNQAFGSAPGNDSRSVNDVVNENSLVSYLSRLNYNYASKYFVSASFRRDGSSRFGVKNQYGNFPSVSAGWVITKEDFIPDTSALSFAKLRASFGVVGNNQLGEDYLHLATVANRSVLLGGNTVIGRTADQLGNPELEWEETSSFDIGTDLGFFDNILTVDYSYYQKNTKKLLFNVPIPLASGFENVTRNLGEIKIWGHEFSVNALLVDTKDLTLNVNANYTFSDNKVLALDTANGDLISGQHITRVGERVGDFYGLDHIGVYVDQADFDNGPIPHSGAIVGSEEFRDADGNGVIERNGDRTVLGSPVPKHYFGFTTSLVYKNFDFNIVASGAAGHLIADGAAQSTGNLDGVFNVNRDVINRWRSPSDPGNGLYGGTTSGTTGPGRDWFNDRVISKGDYLTIKNITLGYNVPYKTNLVKGIRVYGSVQQAFVFTGYKGGNAEVGGNGNITSQGIDNTAYPIPRTFTFGVNFKF